MENQATNDNYTQKELSSRIADRLITVFYESPDAVSSCIGNLADELAEPDPVKMNVYMSIHGLSVAQRSNVGRYDFIPAKDYDLLGMKWFNAQSELHIKENLWQNQDHVMVSVSACEPVKAQEKAYAEFQWLENAARLFVDSDFYDVGITSYSYSHVENAFVTKADGMVCGSSSSLKGSPVPLPFSKVFVMGNSLCRAVDRLGRDPRELTKMQRRIRHAVYLGGLSVHETVPEVAYFLAVSAMEAIFQSDVDKYVNPSIAQQIVESFCYLIGEETNRRNVFEQMRSFYGKRSAVAHGGKTDLTMEDVQLVRAYLRAAILKMIDDPVLSLLKTIEEVAALVRDRKFGIRDNK